MAKSSSFLDGGLSVDLVKPFVGQTGVIAIGLGSETSMYLVRPIACEIGGRGWEILPLGAPGVYHVRIGDEFGHVSCDCIGFLARRECRHIKAMLYLRHTGVLSTTTY